MEAANLGRNDILRLLIDRGALVNETNENMSTALHWAVMGCNVESAMLLIESGADVNAADVDGLTPLHIAAYWCNVTVASMLIAAGAHVNAQDANGQTPLAELLSQVDYLELPEQVETFYEFLSLLVSNGARGWRFADKPFPLDITDFLRDVYKNAPEEMGHFFRALHKDQQRYLRFLLLLLKRCIPKCPRDLLLRILSSLPGTETS